ncbi:beta-galactosidase, partial [Bacillus altitudinis]|uniref:beta-galactosidase n=1 Tax=Bacillus altitudinis TaxID=293387 RepID=UPI001F3D2F00
MSNEYRAESHCDLSQQPFTHYFKDKYNHHLQPFNQPSSTPFSTHTFTHSSQIHSPPPHPHHIIHPINLHSNPFLTAQTINFYQNQIQPLRQLTPHLPLTTNFIPHYPHIPPFLPLHYHQFPKEVHLISSHTYPASHSPTQTTPQLPSNLPFLHHFYPSLNPRQPFLVMESTPSLVNWHQVNK